MKSLNGLALHATDGDLGSLSDHYFDDARWAIRYLVADTGSWLSRKSVLISPIAVREISREKKFVDLNLRRKQVEGSPPIETDQPVSRQNEREYAKYYQYPLYWAGTGLWGLGAYPLDLAGAGSETLPVEEREGEQERASTDHHLRSSNEVVGYSIKAGDGEIGHVEDFILDDKTWAIRYLVIDTRNWLPGKQVLLSPDWIARISWSKHQVEVSMTREAVTNSPAYDPSAPLERGYEEKLFQHYQRPGYW